MSNIILERGKEKISHFGGIAIVSSFIQNLNSFKNINKYIYLGSTNRNAIQADKIILSLCLLNCVSYRSFSNLDILCQDQAIQQILDTTFSSVTFRQKLDSMAKLGCIEEYIDNINVDTLKKADLLKVIINGKDYYTLDIDVTPFCNDNCKKEGVEYTYKKFVGFAPIMAYLGGYALCFSLRPGSQHSENGAVEFLQRCINIINKIGIPLNKILVRVDSGHDDYKFLEKCIENGLKFIIKRNLRSENRDKIFENTKNSPTSTIEYNEYLDIYHNIDYYTKNKKLINSGIKGSKNVVNIVKIFVKKIKDNMPLLQPEIEVQCWWTNLKTSAERITKLYCEHATSEQYHSEVKSEMNLERLPSSKFKTNSLILQIAAISFNVLKKMGDLYIKYGKDFFRNVTQDRPRIKTIIKNLCYRVCKVVHHARKVFFRFGVDDLFFDAIRYIYKKV